MPFYMKRSIVIEAVQYDGSNGVELFKWSLGAVTGGLASRSYVMVETREGPMRCPKGAYVVQLIIKMLHSGPVSAEYYPCDEDVFNTTYRLV